MELLYLIYIVLTISYLLFWGFIDIKKTKHYALQLAGIGAFLVICMTYIIIGVQNDIYNRTVIECYNLGGCMDNKFNRSIIKDYEYENSKSIIDQKINNKEVLK